MPYFSVNASLGSSQDHRNEKISRKSIGKFAEMENSETPSTKNRRSDYGFRIPKSPSSCSGGKFGNVDPENDERWVNRVALCAHLKWRVFRQRRLRHRGSLEAVLACMLLAIAHFLRSKSPKWTIGRQNEVSAFKSPTSEDI